MRKRLRRIAPEAACFLLVAGVYLVHFALAGYDRFYYDAERYWQLGMLFERDGHFSLVSFDHPVRGYSLPLLNYGLQTLASAVAVSDLTIVRVSGALLAATFGVVVAPRLARKLFPGASIGWGRVLAFNALVFVFWRDHFQFPLSDFPALFATSLGVLGLLRGTPAGFLVGGLGIGLAANMRTAYLPVVLVSIAAAALLPARPASWFRRALAPTLVLAGVLLASSPQIAVNQHHRSSWNPLIPATGELTRARLTYGLLVQRTETYVGPRDMYPEPLVVYIDPIASGVREGEDVSEITNYPEYLGIVGRHPAEMAASYLLHTFNGLDVRYPTPYVRDLRDSSIVVSLFQYTLLFAAAMRLLLPEARHRLGDVRWVGVLMLTVPTLTAITGAVEPRYFLPVHMLVYLLVCFGPAFRESFLAGTTARRLSIAVPYLVFLLVSLILSSATQAQIEHPRSDRAGHPTALRY